MIRVVVLLLSLLRPALAETARVYSGEHDDFTRLVIELPATADWVLGRTPMGYAFAVAAVTQPAYDLSAVWDRIPKSRLQALRQDPETGGLQLTLACACHVFPFEYQPGVIVLDIKPGTAPPGSTFEAAFNVPTTPSPMLPSGANALPAYNWRDLEPTTAMGPKPVEAMFTTASGSLDPLRQRLIEEISRGASEGVVDMVLPATPSSLVPSDTISLPWTQIHIGPPADTHLDGTAEGKDGLTPDGETCIPDERLSVAEWGMDHKPLDLLAEARSGLYEEFDTLNTEAALHAVRVHLFLGFGAEANQFARLLSGPDAPEDLAMLQSMALLVDGDDDPGSPFFNMLSCDGAAALWAAFAHDKLPPGGAVNDDAITRSFLALPSHLRRTLGPGLAEKLQNHGDGENARIIRNSLERTPDIPMSTVPLLDAKAELHAGAPEAALVYAAQAVAADGTDVEEWVALVEAHFRNVTPMTADSVDVLRAFEGSIEASGRRQEFFRALALAELLSGQTDAGFHTAEAQGLPLSDLWLVAATLAEDDAFLRHAVSPRPQVIAADVATAVANRLVGLGFPDAALVWLDPVGPEDEPPRRRIAALAEFDRGNARRTLQLLAGLTAVEDQGLRAKAMVQLGQIAEARTAYEAAGLQDEALRLATWERAWPDLATAGPSPWVGAATDAVEDLPDDGGPLARGAAILAASAASRSLIDELLNGVRAPSP